MTTMFTGLAAAAAVAFAGSAVPAAAQAPVHAETGMPFCSASVKDRCIQKIDLKREGKSAAAKK